MPPTHFGLFNDPEWQFDQVDKGLESAARWLERVMPAGPTLEQLHQSFADWVREERERIGLHEEAANAYELVNPSGMSADGLLRYWRKTRGAVVG